jgi:alkylation response protein AidB-like acyl-CoA dehydrogenase
MTRLLAARVAWSSADDTLQIHGDNGYTLEYPGNRVPCCARILNVFDAEFRAEIIARGLGALCQAAPEAWAKQEMGGDSNENRN